MLKYNSTSWPQGIGNFYGVARNYEFKDSFRDYWKVFVIPIYCSSCRFQDDDVIMCSFSCYIMNDDGGMIKFTIEMVEQHDVHSCEELNDPDFKDFSFPRDEQIVQALHAYITSLSCNFLFSRGK